MLRRSGAAGIGGGLDLFWERARANAVNRIESRLDGMSHGTALLFDGITRD